MSISPEYQVEKRKPLAFQLETVCPKPPAAEAPMMGAGRHQHRKQVWKVCSAPIAVLTLGCLCQSGKLYPDTKHLQG